MSDNRKNMTYVSSGVDIHGEGDAIRGLLSSINYRRKGIGEQVDLKGGFTGLIDIGDRYLSMCTDGVGSKIQIAEYLNKWDTIGIDCIAMNVNDLICIGAEPLAFVDYIATENPNAETLREIGKGLNEGARQSNLTIIGGETATLPEIVNGLDLAGTCLGMVDKKKLIIGDNIKHGDLIVGLPSSGIHSNGFTLVRKVIETNDLSYASPLQEIIETADWMARDQYPDYSKEVENWVITSDPMILGEVLLTPTRIYAKHILDLLNNLPDGTIKGMANITGGGMRNLSRIDLEKQYIIDDIMPIPPVFRLIQVLGEIAEKEMYQTFNMGLGMAMVVDPSRMKMLLSAHGMEEAKIIGRVEEGTGVNLERMSIYFEGYV